MKKRFSIISVIALMLTASALTCSIIGIYAYNFFGMKSDLWGDVKDYIELRKTISELYIGEYDGEALSHAALKATVTALDDQWSYYMTADEYEDYQNMSNNQYAGIGVSIMENEETGGIKIMRVFEDSPAEMADIQVNETIVAVDGTDITTLTLDESKDLIPNVVGESVTLTILGMDASERDVTLICELIYKNPVNFEMLDQNVGYIIIDNFEAGTAEKFISAVETLIDENAQSLILDVRNNGGGKVTELTKMLDYLLPEGDIFVSIDEDGNETVTTSDASCIELPMSVLVNENSYSAAEFFAAALDEYDWAVIVGQQTTGKGRSQITVVLSDGGALHISSKEYVTPNRVNLTETGGITPEFIVQLSEEKATLLYYGQLDNAADNQLQKAIEILE